MPPETNNSKQPEYLSFRCPLTIEAADDAEKKMPRFRMVAYTGGVMRITGFPHPVVVDLEGLAIERQDIPVRLDHNPRQGVGHTQRVVIENGQVVAEGLVSRDTSWARDVAKSAVNGFPWQASIGASVVDAQFIPNGQEVTVNGRTFRGPLHVVRQAILKEISFVDSGADTQTSARIAAQDTLQHTPSQEQTSMTATDTPVPGSPGTAGTPGATATTDAAKPTDTAGTPTVADPVTTDDDPKVQEPQKPASTAKQSAAGATPTTVNASANAPTNNDDEPDDNPVVQMRQQIAAETRRIEAIRKICDGKFPAVEAKAIEEGWDEARTELHVRRSVRG